MTTNTRSNQEKKKKKPRDTTTKKVCKFGIEINQHSQQVYSNKPTKFINKKKKTQVTNTHKEFKPMIKKTKRTRPHDIDTEVSSELSEEVVHLTQVSSVAM